MQALQAIPRDLFTRRNDSVSTTTQQQSPISGLVGLASVAAAPFTGGASLFGIGTTATRAPTPLSMPAFGGVGSAYSGYGFGGQGAYGGDFARGYAEGGLVESNPLRMFAEGGMPGDPWAGIDIDALRRNAGMIMPEPRNNEFGQQTIDTPRTGANQLFLRDFSMQGNPSRTEPSPRLVQKPSANRSGMTVAKDYDRNQEVVDKSIDSLLRMAGVQPPAEDVPEEEPTIFGMKYNQDLMRFGLAMLASDKNFGQALGEAGSSVINAKEQDKDKKLKAKLLKQKQIEDQVDLATKLQQLNNMSPEARLAFEEKVLALRERMQRNLLNTRASLRPARKAGAPRAPNAAFLKYLGEGATPEQRAIAEKVYGITPTPAQVSEGEGID